MMDLYFKRSSIELNDLKLIEMKLTWWNKMKSQKMNCQKLFNFAYSNNSHSNETISYTPKPY